MHPGSGKDTRFPWRTASYLEWNEMLLDYFLGGHHRGRTVARIPAGPDELLAAVRDRDADADEVVRAFFATVQAELPLGTSFCGYCHERHSWTADSPDPPRFFGMLYFTCLLAAGHADDHGSFDDRFHAVLGRATPYQCIDRLWEELAAWARLHSAYATLELPPPDAYRSVIGRSYYLAFPNHQDRNVLHEVLAKRDLVGLEPPILPLLHALEEEQNRFGPAFQAELERFLDHYRNRRLDPFESAFWRAIRSEALSSLDVEDGAEAVSITLKADWDDDGDLLLRLVCDGPTTIAGAEFLPLAAPLDNSTHYLVDGSGDPDAIASAALAKAIDLPRGLASLIGQGILLFHEDLGRTYRLAVGDEIEGAEIALVRSDRLLAFQRTFGGAARRSRYEGWYDVEGSRPHPLSELPPGLEGATRLLHTMSTPRPRLVGGIPLAGGYLWVPGLLPRVRCPQAEEVSIRLAPGRSGWRPCERTGGEGDWIFPADLRLSPPATVEIETSRPTDLGNASCRRYATTSCRFVASGHGIGFKPPAAGEYWREGSAQEELRHSGGNPVPLDITTQVPGESADLLAYDPSVRFLGPAIGETSPSRRADHPWVVVGFRKHPAALVYLGDLDRPLLPGPGECQDKGDRRSWRQAFSPVRARGKTWAFVEGRYVRLDAEPRLREILGQYMERAREGPAASGGQPCPPTGPPRPDRSTGSQRARSAAMPLEATARVVEAMAGLGLSRSGVPLVEFQELLGELSGIRDFRLWLQIARAWTEAGLVDLLKRQDRSQTIVVPRPPRFVMIKRGPLVEATLVGLAPSAVVSLVEDQAGTFVARLHPTTAFQPATLRLRYVDQEEVTALARQLGLPSPEWLWWPGAADPAGSLRISADLSGISPHPPPDEYQPDGTWDWREMTFRRHLAVDDDNLVTIERRYHPLRTPIYVLLLDHKPMAWWHLQDWARLRASQLLDQPLFSISSDGSLDSAGTSPPHLPLALGRLCTVLGAALPGPDLADGRIVGYRYPFGEPILTLVRQLLPESWITQED